VQTTLRQISAIKLKEDRMTPLTLIHRSFRGQTSLSLEECIQAEPKHINTVDELGFAPLHWAAMRRNPKGVQTLIEAGAQIDLQASHDCSTPLLQACRQPLSESHECARLLLEAGASPHLMTRAGITALHYAVRGNPDLEEVMSTLKLLLLRGANPRAQTKNRYEPLHCIGDLGSNAAIEKLVTLLLDNGADLEASNTQGRTPLLKALASGSFKMASIFLKAGANASATDLYGNNWLRSITGIGPAEQSPSLLPLDRFPSTDPDAPSQDGHSAVDWLVLRVGAPSLWGHVPKWWAVDMVNLILAVRETNWKDGLFLDKKTILEENGVHRRMTEWVARERWLMRQDSHYEDLHCVKEDVDSWFKSDGDASTCWETASENEGGYDTEDVSESVEDEGNASSSVIEG
jgi:ankyrin repeat protein